MKIVATFSPNDVVREIMVSSLKKLDVIENLNSGGCLYSALGVYHHLKNRGLNSDDVVIVHLEVWKKGLCNIQNNRNFIQEREGDASSGFHFGISCDGGKTIFDSKGEINYNKYLYRYNIPNDCIEVFCQNALMYGDWNWLFCRSTGVSYINSILDVNLVV